MKQTIVVCSTNRGLQFQTRHLVNALKNKGALYLEQVGCSCVTMARNFALTSACSALDDAPKADMVLMLDDDMEASLEAAQSVVDFARRQQRPCSATYTTAEGALAHSVFDEPGALAGTWLSGLGFLAVPREALLRVRAASPVFAHGKRSHAYAFTEAKMHGGKWSSEDYTLCRRFGGVLLAPVAVGHLKVQSLHPNGAQLEEVKRRFAEYYNARGPA